MRYFVDAWKAMRGAAMMSWALPDNEPPSWLATIAFLLGAALIVLAFGAAVLTLLVWL